MAASGVAENLAVGFEWTPFSHDFVYWEYLGPDHLPPAESVDPRINEGAHQAWRWSASQSMGCGNDAIRPDRAIRLAWAVNLRRG